MKPSTIPKPVKPAATVKKPLPTLKGRADVPAMYTANVIKLTGEVTVFECTKREFSIFAELTADVVTRGQGQLLLTQPDPATPIAILRRNAGVKITGRNVAITSAQVPQAIFGNLEVLDSEDAIVCVITPYTHAPILAKSISALVDPPRVRYGTLYERVRLNDYWTELEIMSEPFVNNETFGYCPVIHVKTRVGENKYLQVSPRSIRDILESMRSSGAGLIGIKFRIRKKSTEQQSGFEGYRIAQFS
jgi:hypothetical protein